jgi:hypothetical protein
MTYLSAFVLWLFLEVYWLVVNNPIADTRYLKGLSKWNIQIELTTRKQSMSQLMSDITWHTMGFMLGRCCTLMWILLQAAEYPSMLEQIFLWSLAGLNGLAGIIFAGEYAWHRLDTNQENAMAEVMHSWHSLRARWRWIGIVINSSGLLNVGICLCEIYGISFR